MSKPGSPLLGYNTNVRHKGKLYHIQTEDSGVQHPHIVTHLFADGGRVIASKKTSYAEHVGSDDLRSTVKKLMQEQHKAMFIALRDGVYDEDQAAAGSSAGEVAAPSQGRAGPATGGAAGQGATERRDETPSGAQPVGAERASAESPAAPSAPSDEPRDEMPAGEGRYQPTHPAKQGETRPDPQSESIFGSDLLSERSLDEVILSYLAEDLGETSE